MIEGKIVTTDTALSEVKVAPDAQTQAEMREKMRKRLIAGFGEKIVGDSRLAVVQSMGNAVGMEVSTPEQAADFLLSEEGLSDEQSLAIAAALVPQVQNHMDFLRSQLFGMLDRQHGTADAKSTMDVVAMNLKGYSNPLRRAAVNRMMKFLVAEFASLNLTLAKGRVADYDLHLPEEV